MKLGLVPLLRVPDVERRFGTAVASTLTVQATDLDLSENDFVTILGPSSCGKSTLLRIVAGPNRQTGFCPSCGVRRMAQTATHLVDHVLPKIPVRQWGVSLPTPLRLLLPAVCRQLEYTVFGCSFSAEILSRLKLATCERLLSLSLTFSAT